MAMASRRVVPVSSPPQPRREYWRALVDAHRRSGLSQAAFCRRRGIPTPPSGAPNAPLCWLRSGAVVKRMSITAACAYVMLRVLLGRG